MEEKYGRSWVIRTSFLVNVIIVSAVIYINLLFDWELYLMLFIALTFATPDLMRYVICRRWKPVEAEIKGTEDLSRPYLTSGSPAMANFYQAEIEYHVGETVFRAKMTSSFLPFKKSETIYYDPLTPSVFTQNRGPGWFGLGFLVIVVLSILGTFDHQ